MISIKVWRYFQVLFLGYRSFIKKGEDGKGNSYLIVNTRSSDIITAILNQGFKEEFIYQED